MARDEPSVLICITCLANGWCLILSLWNNWDIYFFLHKVCDIFHFSDPAHQKCKKVFLPAEIMYQQVHCKLEETMIIILFSSVELSFKVECAVENSIQSIIVFICLGMVARISWLITLKYYALRNFHRCIFIPYKEM